MHKKEWKIIHSFCIKSNQYIKEEEHAERRYLVYFENEN